MWTTLLPIGRDPRTGGYRRFVWNAAEQECRQWFLAEAAQRDLDARTDQNGNLWAWWGDPDGADESPGAVTGSHLDSVPAGGAYDGPLGVVSAFAALDLLRERGVQPARPLGIVAFADEEGARFGVACAGSRLLTGSLKPDLARALVDADGISYAEAMERAGHDPTRIGRDDQTLEKIGVFVELHVEQGRGLVDLDAPVALAEGIWPHGRWRFEFAGEANHAGTTRMEDRRDPMLTYAMTALAANKRARLTGTRATFGRIEVEPSATNAVPSRITAWLDARAPDQGALDQLLADIGRQARDRAGRDGTVVDVRQESVTPMVAFDAELRRSLARVGPTSRELPVLPTQAGHDAGILAEAGVPVAMLFVRNPTGVSHSPEEYAEPADCHAGVEVLASALEELLAR